MLELLNSFVRLVTKQSHLKPILPVSPVRICLQSGYKLHFIEISTTACLVTNDSQARIDIWVKGDDQAISSLILGNEKLRKLEIRNEVKITGKLRDILMVEALFYLTERKMSA
ncbi:hypothetical protein [Bacillus suaedaesalsae]|uniref:SCP2 domain-containing protein n=1 Tax=Bacillus suaedaesalsae TaxID=2810349 RepID=A0ABS2DLG4_9BACI|nr:hypothetical protein [Bacillus suaedaesalsae]MBM6618885.1 hypothetical protein [Bacillus suaedaesalsae]